MLYKIVDGTLSAGSETVLSHFDFEIKGKDRIAVIGPNGSGKTTLLRLIAGELELDRDDKAKGPVLEIARSITIDMLHQQAFSDDQITVTQLIMQLCPYRDSWDRERFEFENEYDRLFTGFGFKLEDKKKKLSEFSGGQQTRIALIRLLLSKPDILLLDEPTNHLDMDATLWLENYLKDYPKAVVMVSHDRFFLDEACTIIYEIEDKKLKRYSGGYSQYKEQKLKAIQIQKKQYEQQQAELERLNSLIEKFKHKPKKASMARAKKKQIERMVKINPPGEMMGHIFTGDITPEVFGAKWVLETEQLKIGYDRVLLELSLRMKRGQKIGIIGPNGVGKSTFLKTVAGIHEKMGGTYQLGNHVIMGYFDQHSAMIKSDQSILEHFTALFPSLPEKDARHYLASYLFKGAAVSKKISSLSGGEKSRLVLAEMFKALPNLMVLDEPTNHMDIPAKETLESAFKAYKGSLLFVSHDRYFISQVADALLIFEEGQAFYYPFGYKQYLRHLENARIREEIRRQAPESEQGIKEDILQRISPEDQVMITKFQAVPKGSTLLGRELSTEQAFLDWQRRLAKEAFEEKEEKLMALEAEIDRMILGSFTEEGILSTDAEDIQEEHRKLHEVLTESYLKWYDLWQEMHPLTIEEEDAIFGEAEI